MNSKNLPQKIPIFPLSNAVIFPKTILPLNIFEDRYIQLVDDCMKGQRLFGMVQPRIRAGFKPRSINKARGTIIIDRRTLVKVSAPGIWLRLLARPCPFS